MKIRELRKLPQRDWDKPSTYDSLLIIGSGCKHDSGYSLMYVIGETGREPIEIAAACDDINWHIPHDLIGAYNCLRTDMNYPSNIIRMWMHGYRFEVGRSLSSTTITIIKE